MKKVYTFSFAVILTAVCLAQTPQKMSYQAVIRNGGDQLVTNHSVGMRLSILQGTNPVYVETHATTTNANGLVSIEIGNGTFVSGVAFSAIDWSAGVYSIKTETDPTGGTNYTAIVGTSPLLSVPYALYAKTVASYTEIDPNAVLLTGDQTIAGNKTFTGTTTVQTPVNATDAATKAYVDLLLVQIEALKAQIEPSLLANGFIDTRDNNHYDVVKTGKQIWMGENLKYLPSVVGPGTGSRTTPYYYVYGYDGTDVNDAKAEANYANYGVLYNWPAAMNGAASSTANPSGVQGVCPTGWHLPSDAEWTQLTDYLGGTSIAGGKLKETGTTHWNSPNTGATNETGFTALPGGFRDADGTFGRVGSYGFWWSATEGAGSAWYRFVYYSDSNVYSFDTGKEAVFSVRCVRD